MGLVPFSTLEEPSFYSAPIAGMAVGAVAR